MLLNPCFNAFTHKSNSIDTTNAQKITSVIIMDKAPTVGIFTITDIVIVCITKAARGIRNKNKDLQLKAKEIMVIAGG